MKRARFPLVLAIAAGVVTYAVWRSSQTGVEEVKLIGFQGADKPSEMPKDGDPDMRFHSLSAWDANRIPIVARMDTPMGSENGALVYNAQKFWEMNSKRGGHHAGDDLNGIGGMNTDLGDPVFAAGDGLVVFTGNPSPGWGNTVILAHRTPDGKPLHTMYAHLLAIKVGLGELVARGARVGAVGTADGYYPAHLHFEARSSDGIDIGGGYLSQPLNRLDPGAVVAALHEAGPEGISPSPLGLVDLGPEAPWTTLEIENAGKIPGLAE